MTTDLHVHLGGAVPAPILWEIAQDQGLAIPHKTFGEFQEALSSSDTLHKSLDEFLGKYFHLTEEIQSSPQAVAASVYQTIAKSHRRAATDIIEIRFNPAKRLRGGLHSMDSILLSAGQGLERACLHYGVRASLILSLGRDCPQKTNLEILEAAIRWHSARPSIFTGLDIAGPESQKLEADKAWFSHTTQMFLRAAAHGIKTTYHVGETAHTGWKNTLRVLTQIRPNRIGHGIELRNAPPKILQTALDTLASTNTCLELCPSVNLATQSIRDFSELQAFARLLTDNHAPFTAATDNPYLVHTNPKRELDILAPKENSLPIREWALACGEKFSFTS